MPMGMPYPKGKMAMQKGKMSMSEMMGVERKLPPMESKEHGMKMGSMKDIKQAEAKEYGKAPASRMAMAKGEVKEHGRKAFGFTKKK
jgi:hypothetical protein